MRSASPTRSSARSMSGRGSWSRPTSTTSATPTGCSATCRSRASAWTSPASSTGTALARMSTIHGGRHNAEFIANQEGLGDQWLFAGIVDGRNVWINHLEHSLDALDGLQTRTAQLVVSTSCSLLHTPIDLDAEPSGVDADLDDEMRSWMAFAAQKVGEVATLAKGVAEGRDAIADELDANDRARDSRRDSHRTSNIEVRARIDGTRRGARSAHQPVRGAQAGAAGPHRHPRALPRDDDRLLPPDRRDPADPREGEARRDRLADLQGGHAERDREGDPLPGGRGPRRARARRAGAQRHGPVLRRADGGLRLHRERLGAVLRLALRAAADHLRRRAAAVAR